MTASVTTRAAVVIATFALLISATISLAATPPIVPPDGVILSGKLADSEANGTLRLLASTETTEVILSGDGLDLQATTSGVSPLPIDHLDATAISFSSSTFTLTPGKPADVRVTVKGFRYAGTYVGTITLEYAAPPPAPSPPTLAPPYKFVELGNSIALTVNVTADPAIAAVASSPIKISKTKCFDFLECSLAEAWADHVELTDTVAIDLRNTGQASGRVINPGSTITDRETGTSPAVSPINVTTPDDLIAPGDTGQLSVAVDRETATHGEHDGTITFVSEGIPGQTALAFELTVRERPVWLIGWVCVGVIATSFLAWLARQKQYVEAASAGKKQLEALRNRYAADIEYVDAAMKELDAKEKWTPTDQATANRVATDLHSLDIVRAIERRIGDPTHFKQTVALIKEVRDYVTAGNSNDAAAAADDARDMVLAEAPAARRWADGLESTERQEALASLRSVMDLASLRALPRIISPVVEARVITRLYSAVRLLAAAAFVILGLKFAYLDTTGFTGASAKDVLTLITYGAGADTVSRYLSSFLPKSA